MVTSGGQSSSRAVRWIYLAFLGHIVALLLFDAGMFPVKPVTVDNASWDDYGREPGTNEPVRYGRRYKRLVVVLVDGIRADFVWSKKKLMPFTQSLLDDAKGLGFVTLAHAPTVTLPRIKAILTGSVPLFSDAILNVQQSSAITQDNLLYYMKQVHGSKIVAYGDNIWGTLFPESDSFLRSEWVVSFFVSDFVHVDLNVTQHVASEVSRSDWDVLILHYLGLDHIGHFEGPTSSHVPAKLLEMDNIVHTVYQTLDADSLLLVLGDHGTGDAGGHGGSSAAEVRTPALLFSPTLVSNKLTPDAAVETVNQIDLASTLSVLLGLPIPKSNMGGLMHSVLQHAFVDDPRKLLNGLLANALQLMGALNASSLSSGKTERLLSKFAAIRSLHGSYVGRLGEEGAAKSPSVSQLEELVSNYGDLLQSISAALIQSSVLYDGIAMAVALYLLMSIFILCAVYLLLPSESNRLVSSSLLLVSSLCSVFFQVFLCTSPLFGQSSWVCSASMLSLPVSLLIFVTSTFNICGIYLLFRLVLFRPRILVPRCFHEFLSTPISTILWLGTVCHLSLLGASSFVEEEHQIWYFLASSLVLCILVYGKLQRKKLASRPSAVPSQYTYTGVHQTTCCCVSLVLLRITRSWNQTGDKWLHLPDLSSWLASDNKLLLRSAIGFFSLTLIGGTFVRKFLRGRLQQWSLLLLVLGLLFVYLARSASRQFYCPAVVLWFLSGDGYVEAHVVYYLCLALLAYDLLSTLVSSIFERLASKPDGRGLFSVHSVYLLLMCLLSRPQNVAVVCSLTLQHLIFDAAIWPKLSAWQVAMSSLWMGFAGFYMQGNSNALSKMDLTAGYVGMRDFEPARVFLLLTLSVWASLLTWLIAGFGHIAQRQLQQTSSKTFETDAQELDSPGGSSDSQSTSVTPATTHSVLNKRNVFRSQLSEFCATVMVYQMAISTVVAMVSMAMRNHIMVWTVFSPKLLYITSQSIHIFCLVSVMGLAEASMQVTAA